MKYVMIEIAYYIAGKAKQILGGTLSVNQYKDYVLALLFLKSASEYYKSNDSFQSDENKPFLRLLVSERSSFDYLYKELGSLELGKLINVALYELEQANSRVIEGYEINRAINFESNILGDTDERLSKLRELLHFFQKLTLTDDAGKLIDIGALYNLLLYIFAEEAGKKINNVLTPKEVIGLVAELIGDNKDNNSLCDPVSGSGTLLVEVGKRVGIRGANIFGQEANWNQYALTKMNLMLNGFKDSTFFWGDSLSNPKLTDDGGLKLFDIVASIPPFADKWATEEAEFDRYGRFQYGIPPRSQATWAYISHILASLKPNGRAVVVVPAGVLFRTSESKIRHQIIEHNLLEAVIELPQNLFYGAAISTAILVFRKDRKTTQTLFMDARKGYISNKGIYKLSDTMVEQLLNTYKGFLSGEQVWQENSCPAYIATQEEVRNNKYDWQTVKYVEEKIERVEVDVEATLQRIEKLEKRLEFVNEQLEYCTQQLIRLTNRK